jgi:hypothetical protein
MERIGELFRAGRHNVTEAVFAVAHSSREHFSVSPAKSAAGPGALSLNGSSLRESKKRPWPGPYLHLQLKPRLCTGIPGLPAANGRPGPHENRPSILDNSLPGLRLLSKAAAFREPGLENP